MEDRSNTKIAIVGAGPAGMVALKEFLALGYDVTVFEKKDDVGGTWNWSEDTDATTALKETTLCNNKYSCVLGDFPIPKDFPWTVPAPLLGQYLRSYATHHTLYPHIHFHKTVTRLSRSHSPLAKKWLLHLSDESLPRPFDKVIWCTGCFVRPRPLTLPDQHLFTGTVVHASQARDLTTFKGKNVLVLGIGNTAADISNALVRYGANEVYLSHRRGAKIMSPVDAETGVPTDVMLTTGLAPVTWFVQRWFPAVYGWAMDSALRRNFKDTWGVAKREWGLDGPSMKDGQHVMVCSGELVPNIKTGKVRSVRGVKRVTGPGSVKFDDGEEVERVDAIILCVGYADDMDVLEEAVEFTPPKGEAGPRLPRLYMNIFPPGDADSFAHLTVSHLLAPHLPARELSAMALAQIWARKEGLPGREEMERWIEGHQKWVRGRIERAPNGFGYQEIDNWDWYRFLHRAAGTGLYEHIGWSWKAWSLWWNDRNLYRAISNLPICAYTYRLFDMGKRKPYEGAREAILAAYADLVELQKGVGKKVN